MDAPLDNSSALQDEDFVRGEYGREPVGDQDAGTALDDGIDRILNPALRNRVQGGRGLVEDEQRGILQQDARDGDALLFAAGEFEPAVSHDGVQPELLVFDKIQDVGPAARVDHLRLRGVFFRIQEIVADRAVEQVGFLADDADLTAQPGEVEASDIGAVEGNRAVGDIPQTGDEVDQRALAGAGGPDDRDAAAFLQIKADVVQNRVIRFVGEADVREGNRTLCPLRRHDGVRRGCSAGN